MRYKKGYVTTVIRDKVPCVEVIQSKRIIARADTQQVQSSSNGYETARNLLECM